MTKARPHVIFFFFFLITVIILVVVRIFFNFLSLSHDSVASLKGFILSSNVVQRLGLLHFRIFFFISGHEYLTASHVIREAPLELY